MGNEKLCDIHKSKERRVDREKISQIAVERWFKVQEKNRLFENRIDACLECQAEVIFSRAKGLGLDLEKEWRTAVWQTGDTGKKYKTMMTMDEFTQYMKDKEIEKLRAQVRQ